MRKTVNPMPSALAGAAALLLAAGIAGCGQQGPLYIPDTPAAQQRATLPQTLFGGAKAAGTANRAVPPDNADGEEDPRDPDTDLDDKP